MGSYGFIQGASRYRRPAISTMGSKLLIYQLWGLKKRREFHTPAPGSSPCSGESPSAQANISVAPGHILRASDLNLDVSNVPGATKVRFLGRYAAVLITDIHHEDTIAHLLLSSHLDHVVARCPELVLDILYLPHSDRNYYLKILSEILKMLKNRLEPHLSKEHNIQTLWGKEITFEKPKRCSIYV